MKRFAVVRIEGNSLVITVDNLKIADLEKTIYAFVIGKQIVRIGSSKKKLRQRMNDWQRDVTKRLNVGSRLPQGMKDWKFETTTYTGIALQGGDIIYINKVTRTK